MQHASAVINASGEVVDVAEKIIKLVKRLEDENTNRKNISQDAFVKNIVNNVSVESDGKYNVMVMNLDLPEPAVQTNPPTDIITYTSVEAFGTIFGIWVFKGAGEFTNLGQLGYRNWMGYGFLNRFDLDGKENDKGRVMRFTRCE